MLRHAVVFLALCAPLPALACGMYVPEQKKALLADLIEQVDQKAEDVKVEVKAEPAVEAETANTTNDDADAPEAVPSA